VRREDRAAVVNDLDEEFRTLLLEGVSPVEARRWYRRQVWGSTLPLLRTRGSGVFGLWGATRSSWLDVRLALRMLVKHPGLTLVAVFALAIGIPVGLAPSHAAAIFELPLPVPEGDRIHVVKNGDRRASQWSRSTLVDRAEWSDRLSSFEGLAAVRRTGFNVEANGSGGRDLDGVVDPTFEGAEVAASALQILRVRPLMGRLPTPEDERVGAEQVVVISHDLWVDQMAGDPDAVGRTIQVAGVPRTVVGVMPSGFHFPYRAHLWIPLQAPGLAVDDGRNWVVFGRLVEGASREAAESEAIAIGPASIPGAADRVDVLRPAVVPFSTGLFGLTAGGLRAEQGFYFVQLLALFVLVVACLNIGMLMLVRTTSRASELAVRTALGASRARVVSQLFLESFVLAVVAAGVGLLLAEVASRRLGFMDRLLPYWFDLGITPRTAVWALALAVVSAALVGIVPGLKVTGRAVQKNIQRAAAGRTGVRFGGVSSALIVTDVALAVMAVGLAFGFGVDQLDSVTGGEATLKADEYLAATFSIPELGPPPGAVVRDGPTSEARGRVAEAQRELIERLREDPRVRALAIADVLPGMDEARRRFEVSGRDVGGDQPGLAASLVHMVPGFFEALEQPLLSGRDLSGLSGGLGASEAVVNSQFVADFFDGGNAIGQRIREVDRAGVAVGGWLEVVGTVGDVRRSATDRRGGPVAYTKLEEGSATFLRLALRIGPDPTAFTGRLRELSSAVEPASVVVAPMALSEVESFDDSVLRWMALGVNTMIAILIGLAASGTYALLSFTVGQREREIAVRTALGSPKGALLVTVGRRALLQLGVGAVGGMLITGAFYAMALRDGWNPTISPVWLTLSAGLSVLVVIGGVALAGPTRQGLRIEPSRALKS
jgi:predicted permease